MKTYGPYTPIFSVGDFAFVSGQVGVDSKTGRSAAGVKEQTKQVLTNMRNLIEENGYSMNQIAKTTIFLTDIDDFAAMNEVYETFFEAPRPARSTVAVKELPKVGTNPLKVEIEAVIFNGIK